MPSGGQNWRKSIENENSRCPLKRGFRGISGGGECSSTPYIPIWGDATTSWRGVSRELVRVSGSRREEMAKEMADAAREAAEQKARSELGSLQGKFDIFLSDIRIIGIWNAPTLERQCLLPCGIWYSSAIFAPFFCSRSSKSRQKQRRSRRTGQNHTPKSCLFLKPQVLW